MITVPITIPWHIATPTVFRLLEATFVDQFFADGSLRLSSFAQFRRHTDEQRLDLEEGETSFVHRTQQHGGQTLFARAFHGHNAYVLCGTMRYQNDLLKAFGADSYIRINNPTEFGMRVARHIPGLVAGIEGACLYQDVKIVERDLGYIDLNQFSEGGAAPKRELIDRYINQQMGHYPLFLKHTNYSAQLEYRLVWLTTAATQSFIDIKVPEAIELCSRPNTVTE